MLEVCLCPRLHHGRADQAYFSLSLRVEWYHSNAWEDVNAVCQCIYVFIYRLLLVDMYIGDTISLLAA